MTGEIALNSVQRTFSNEIGGLCHLNLIIKFHTLGEMRHASNITLEPRILSNLKKISNTQRLHLQMGKTYLFAHFTSPSCVILFGRALGALRGRIIWAVDEGYSLLLGRRRFNGVFCAGWGGRHQCVVHHWLQYSSSCIDKPKRRTTKILSLCPS